MEYVRRRHQPLTIEILLQLVVAPSHGTRVNYVRRSFNSTSAVLCVFRLFADDRLMWVAEYFLLYLLIISLDRLSTKYYRQETFKHEWIEWQRVSNLN